MWQQNKSLREPKRHKWVQQQVIRASGKHKRMILKHTLKLAVLTTTIVAWQVLAQETEQNVRPDADDEERITVLDQVVPVADEDLAAEDTEVAGPPAALLGEAELSDRELLLAEFDRYKVLKAAGVFDEAENVAKRIVEMSIHQSGPTSNDTAKALSNLAIAQHGTKNFEAAQQNFQSAINIITENEDNLSAMLVNPLTGLGAAQLEGGRPDLASRTYSQAVHISHVNEGPHNLEQILILEALAETNLRLGSVADAKNNQDMIYALNIRHFTGNAMEMVPSLMRRAKWQRRTGYILDERATYRRIIRIVEDQHGKDDFSLIDPLTKLGQSYYFIDTSSDASSMQSATIASGEMYFKRAVRISENHPESDWQAIAATKLALADYYNFKGDQGRARKTYRDIWNLLSEDEERFAARLASLETTTLLNEDPIPRYVGSATRSDRDMPDSEIREGQIIMSYDISTRGRVTSLKVVEYEPKDFEEMRRFVVRELRTRIYRPRFIDAQPVATPNQVFTHTFYYTQEELESRRAAAEAKAAKR